MRYGAIVALMLAISFAGPAFAQQTNVADQKMRQEVEAVVTQYVDAINKGDAQSLAALFGPNAVDITPYGKYTQAAGQIEDSLEVPHKLGLTLAAKVDDIEPLFGGQGAVATAPYTGTLSNNPGTSQVRGNLLFVLERAGIGWKVRIATASRLVPAPAK